MLDKIRSIILKLSNKLSSRTVKDSALVFAGNFAGQGLGFLSTLILIRELGPARFGVLSTVLTIMALATQFTDLGISTGFVRYASKYLKEDQRKAEILFKITLYLKLSIGLLVLFLGLIITRPLSSYIFNTSEVEPLIRLAFIGSLGSTLWGFLQAILQAKQWFMKYAWINVFNNCIKLMGISWLAWTGSISQKNALIVIILIPFIGFFVDSFLVPKSFLKIKAEKEEKKQVFLELFHFSKWITLATLCTMLITRIDVLLLQALSTSDQVGIYNSALQLAMILPIITGSISTIMLPKISSISEKSELIAFVDRTIKLLPYLILLLFVLELLSGPLVLTLFGDKYVHSIPVFRLLLLGFILGIFVNQISIVAFTLNKVRFITFVIYIELAINILLDVYLIPEFGAVGAAISNLTIKIFGNVLITYYILKIIGYKFHVRNYFK